MGDTDNAYTSQKGGLWVQPYGANTEPIFVGCHDVDEINEPMGGASPIRCFDPSGDGWTTKGTTRTPPDLITSTINTLLFENPTQLELLRDRKFALYLLTRDAGRADEWSNYRRGLILGGVTITARTKRNLARREEDAQSEQGFSISAEPPGIDVFSLAIARQSTSETEELTDIAFENKRAQSSASAEILLGQNGYITSNPLGASPANIANMLYTITSGGTWAQSAANPFAAAYGIASAVVFGMGRATSRVVVARGTAIGGAPAAIAYSDDRGATFGTVNVGAVNGQYMLGPHALYARDLHHVWAVTNSGYIYKSTDGAVSFTAINAGVATAQNLYCIHFSPNDPNVGIAGGANGALVKTIDGGVSWAAVSGPAAEASNTVKSVWAVDLYHFWATYSDGKAYYTVDGGTTWSLRGGSWPSGGSLDDMKFANDYVGFAIHNTSAPVGTIYRTIDGGYNWTAETTPTNAGLNSLAVLSENVFYAVGKAQGGTGVILKGSYTSNE